MNKDTLYHYLAERFIDFHYSTTQILVVTYIDAILKTQDVPDVDINSYKYEEGDASMIQNFIRLSKRRMFNPILDPSSKIYNVNVNARAISLNTGFPNQRCNLLPFMKTRPAAIRHKQTGLCAVLILSNIMSGTNISNLLLKNIYEPLTGETQSDSTAMEQVVINFTCIYKERN